MKSCFPLKALIGVVVSTLCLYAQSQTPPALPVSSQFASLTKNWFQPWPAVPVGSLRLWNTGTSWAQINPANGVYNWRVLDNWIAAAQSHRTDLVLTMAKTPAWASSNPYDSNCRYGPAGCAPPTDLNPDGTGTDQHWKNFVTAVAKHVAGRIKLWEMWNEPGWTIHWTGTPAQMVRMVKDARAIILSIDPTARIISPANQAMTPFHMKWWTSFADAGGLQYIDVVAFHGYTNYYPLACGVHAIPELLPTHTQNLRTMLASHGQVKPLWDTEGSWGSTSATCLNNQDMQAAFVARSFLLHWSENVKRFYWYQYQGDTGGLANSSGGLLKSGVAYKQIQLWMTGATMTTLCSAVGTVWTCNFSRPGGHIARAVWDSSQTCANGTCTTIGYKIGTQWKNYRTLDGGTVAITGTMVPIGAKPILLEN